MKGAGNYEAVFVNGEWVIRNRWAWKNAAVLLSTTARRVQEAAQRRNEQQKAKS